MSTSGSLLQPLQRPLPHLQEPNLQLPIRPHLHLPASYDLGRQLIIEILLPTTPGTMLPCGTVQHRPSHTTQYTKYYFLQRSFHPAIGFLLLPLHQTHQPAPNWGLPQTNFHRTAQLPPAAGSSSDKYLFSITSKFQLQTSRTPVYRLLQTSRSPEHPH